MSKEAEAQHFEEKSNSIEEVELRNAQNLNARLANPLSGRTHAELEELGERFALDKGLEEYIDEFKKGAIVAQDPLIFESLAVLSDEDKNVLRREITHRFDQPKALYFMVFIASLCAAVQGMDESVINGANLFFPTQFGISTAGANAGNNQWILGLVNGAPYLCCAVVGSWLTEPLNRQFGRRGTIFLTASVSLIACIFGALSNNWYQLMLSRFLLGLGIGPKSATVPVYAAECSPANIRGAMVMNWQVWTAFGIAVGTAANLAFLHVPDVPGILGLNWRLMLGSASFPAFFVVALVYRAPESPRWLMSKGRYVEAYESLCQLRHTKLQAARDLFYIHALLLEEDLIPKTGNRYLELFTVGRNRRAALASGIVMFMQQFCGINVIAYYSTTIFTESGFGITQAFVASLGFGMINFFFAAPAFFTIDTFGRRFLLLLTFPMMSAFLLLVGMAFFIEDLTTRIAIVAIGIYGHVIVYSPGEGPVPFTYSAEAFPLYIRDIGMSFAVAVTWGFNFIVALTFPRLLGTFKPQGAFGFYAAMNIVGWFLILMFVPETKALSLEELDQVFNVSTRAHASYQLRQVPYWFGKHVLRRDMGPQEQLYAWEKEDTQEKYVEKFIEKGSRHA